MTRGNPTLTELHTGHFLSEDTAKHRRAARDGIGLKFRIAQILRDALGEDEFHVDGSGIGPGDSNWFRALTGDHVIEVRVTPTV